jgi:hypothetical protein
MEERKGIRHNESHNPTHRYCLGCENILDRVFQEKLNWTGKYLSRK